VSLGIPTLKSQRVAWRERFEQLLRNWHVASPIEKQKIEAELSAMVQSALDVLRDD
jgi:hypothetical protein